MPKSVKDKKNPGKEAISEGGKSQIGKHLSGFVCAIKENKNQLLQILTQDAPQLLFPRLSYIG